MLPAESRSIASGVLLIIYALEGFLLTKMIPTLVLHLTLAGFAWTLFAINFLFLITYYFVMPETSGLTLEEIEAKFIEK